MKNISLDDILVWIVQHSEDTDSIDKINRASYPFTSKFRGQ